MEPRVIKDFDEYQYAMKELEELARIDPPAGSDQAARLELLALLIENFERDNFPIGIPDPIEAIKFRMEQEGLSNRDLEPYIGSRSKVHEVLTGKRPLTIKMIRALNEGLQIPAEALLKPTAFNFSEDLEIEWSKFPIKEMIKRGWIEPGNSTESSIARIQEFLAPLTQGEIPHALFKRTIHERTGHRTDTYALYAWIWRVRIVAKAHLSRKVEREIKVDQDFMNEIAKLSWFANGPTLAQEFLYRHGISLVIERHLPRTYLDGAAIGGQSEIPIIALTLRHDRLDNFWHTLMHELAHISLHLDKEESVAFVDDLDVDVTDSLKEREADQLAQNVLLPASLVRHSRAFQQRTPAAIQELADRIHRSPAVIAGKIRHDSRNYRILSQYIGAGQVRKQFKNPLWKVNKNETY